MVVSVFLKSRPIYLRLDIVPFLVIFPIFFIPMYNKIMECYIPDEPDYPSNSTFAFIFDHVDVPKLEPYTVMVLFPVLLIIIEIVILFLPYWNVGIRNKIHFMETNQESATHVSFIPKKYRGSPAIVPLIREKGKNPYTVFQQKKRELINGKWESLKYPNNLTAAEYTSSQGLTEAEASKRFLQYGPNGYSIPVPGFIELLFDQLRSPLFVFQLFSISFSLIDDSISAAVMLLFSSIIFECSTVRQRQSNFLELRGVETPPITLHVKRNKEWKKVTSDIIVPGDLVLLDQETMCPCDLVVISGRAVVNEAMLTGESTPQIKDTFGTFQGNTKLSTTLHKNCILFGGTNIEQIIPSKEKGLPEKGVVCVVLATGLGSSQGRLIRTILFSTDKNSVETKDAYYLLIFLSFFAFYFAGYLIYYGRKMSNISTFRLTAFALSILTMTIPPDLPVQMNLQVNSSLLALSRLKTFCTEPFRIPYAGMITCCCFDKTGTLTSEEYCLVGVDDLHSPPAPKNSTISGNYYNSNSDMPIEALWVIGGCHSLVRGKYGQLVGDSLESAALSAMKYKLKDTRVMNKRASLKINNTFLFSSELRKMTTVCQIDGEEGYVALMKGAADSVAELLDEVPENYMETCRSYTKQGCRVLALAYRRLNGDSYDPHAKRETIECHMTFAGFIIFSAAIKRGSEDTIVQLLRSKHRVVIITGDDPLTACHVAKVLHIIKKQPAIHDLKVTDEDGKELSPEDEKERVLCYTGRALEKLSPEDFSEAVRHCNIFARMSPQMKANIIIKLNDLGYKTLMCGDGTNDVSALKQANVGVGLVEKAEEEDPDDVDPLKQIDQPVTTLGAASIASPFVSKRPTITACIDLVRSGRSTLSSTLDLFKQLSLQNLVNAFEMSILFLEDVRFGERQNIIFSVITMVAAFSIAWAVPTRTLSKMRPFPNQFNLYLIVSVVFQYATHIVFLQLTQKLCFDNGFKISKYGFHNKFQPNLLSTALYIMKGVINIITITANYRGHPFMQSFSDNKSLLAGLVLSSLIIVVLLLEVHPAIRKIFQLVEFPNREFQIKLSLYCLLDAVICFFGERVILAFFTKKNEDSTKELVDDEIANDLDDYITNDDDILPDEAHEFGLMEMLKSNVQMQTTIREKNLKNAEREKKKKEQAAMMEKELATDKTNKKK